MDVSVNENMITTAFELPRYRVERNIGLVRGITVRFAGNARRRQHYSLRGNVRDHARASARIDDATRQLSRRQCRHRRPLRFKRVDARRHRSPGLRHRSPSRTRRLAPSVCARGVRAEIRGFQGVGASAPTKSNFLVSHAADASSAATSAASFAAPSGVSPKSFLVPYL
jgi:hypothetical protein